MDPIIEPSVRLMAVNAGLLQQAVSGLTEDQLWASPSAASNPLIWIAGHLAATRDTLLGALTGERVALPWFKAFGRGAARIGRADCPPLVELQQAMDTVSTRLLETLATQTAAQLERPAPFKVPGSDGTMRGLVAFISFHETYHIGQAAYLRKWLGFPGIVG